MILSVHNLFKEVTAFVATLPETEKREQARLLIRRTEEFIASLSPEERKRFDENVGQFARIRARRAS
jgi:hypothetical protein